MRVLEGRVGDCAPDKPTGPPGTQPATPHHNIGTPPAATAPSDPWQAAVAAAAAGGPGLFKQASAPEAHPGEQLSRFLEHVAILKEHQFDRGRNGAQWRLNSRPYLTSNAPEFALILKSVKHDLSYIQGEIYEAQALKPSRNLRSSEAQIEDPG